MMTNCGTYGLLFCGCDCFWGMGYGSGGPWRASSVSGARFEVCSSAARGSYFAGLEIRSWQLGGVVARLDSKFAARQLRMLIAGDWKSEVRSSAARFVN